MNENKAEIVGFLCAEGCYVKSCGVFSEMDKRRGNVYTRIKNNRVIEFGNYNTILLNRFAHLIEKEYGYKPNIIKNYGKFTKIALSRKRIIDDLLAYSDYGTFKWCVPKDLFTSSLASKYAFLRGFVDGDGNIDHRSIRFFSANKRGLEQISELLNTMKIRHNIHGPFKSKNKSDMYNIYIGKYDIGDVLPLLKSSKFKYF